MDRLWDDRRLHFVGIGGAGMSGLALVAQELGASVTGSDRSGGSSYAARLREAGIETVVGHDAANVPEGAEVVYSTAIGPENPERAAAASELHRADLLAELTRLRPTIAVSGTHGKTTTSSMLVHALRDSGVAGGRRLRVRPVSAQARPQGCGPHQRRARPSLDLQLAPRRRGDVPRVPGRGGGRGGVGAAGAAGAGARRAARVAVRGRPDAVAGRLVVLARRDRCGA